MNVLLLASHAVAEFDDVRMFSDMGVDVFAPGGYADPRHPGESSIRPAIPNAPDHPYFRLLCDQQRAKHGSNDPAMIDWAKGDVHPDILDWADVVIVHHFPERWIPQLIGKRKRVIWRTCGQSNPELELFMRRFRTLGLEIVRYSPAERRYFESVRAFAGEDALIRFGKYPDDYGPWIGDEAMVGNVTQDMYQRGDACGLSFWLAATEGLPTKPAGKGSEALPGGIGQLSYEGMLDYLRHIRAYLYTGTVPASYTLGLIEAMLSGVPVVSIGPKAWQGPDLLFEGEEIAVGYSSSDPQMAREFLSTFMVHDPGPGYRPAAYFSPVVREQAIDLFGIDTVSAQWAEFLGVTLLRGDVATAHVRSAGAA